MLIVVLLIAAVYGILHLFLSRDANNHEAEQMANRYRGMPGWENHVAYWESKRY